MDMKSTLKLFYKRVITVLLLALCMGWSSVFAQKLRFGIFADPVISWFSSDTHETESKGARSGFNFGLIFNKYFSENYAFSTGLNILNAGGQIVNSVPIVMEFKNMKDSVPAGETVIYKVQYLSIPLGLKFNTNQIGYVSFFTDLGLDPKIVIGGKADIPYSKITGENALEELRLFNLSYHITGGIEYSIGATTALVFGLGFDNNFLDITKDNGKQPIDKISHKIIKFHLGINF
jgi:hypothetical protein